MIDSKELENELRVFSDPATPFSVKEVGESALELAMVRDFERTYRINLQSGAIVALHAGAQRFNSVSALLASSEFADIRRFKANQKRILEAKFASRGDGYLMLEPEGKFLTRNGVEEPLNRVSLEAATSVGRATTLSILLIDGPAGIGKTSLIEHVSLQRSAPDSAQPPLLHVTSSGSKLTDLPKALAHALQVIRSTVTFDQVPILARRGVIQVAIDGFDELVDPDGYKDAWSALRDFLGDVRVGGPIILSGRDTFFDQQDFEKLLAKRLSNLSIKQARLSPVSPAAAKKYLEESGWSKSDVSAAQSSGWLRAGSYQLRPFFLAQIAGEDGWDELQLAHGSPQSFLVSRMVRREADLVARTVDIDVRVAESCLWAFFETVAEDMAIQQSEQVDEDFLGFACEAAFQGEVASQDLGKLMHRAGSFALLESAGQRGVRRFPHSEFQNQFAARALANVAKRSSLTNPFVRQCIVTASLAEAFADYFMSLSSSDASLAYNNLIQMLANEGYSNRGASNIGALLMATLGRADLEPLSLSSVGLPEVKVVGVLRRASLKDVAIGHFYAAGADCRAIEFQGESSVSTLTVDSSSVLPLGLPSVTQVQVVQGGLTRTLRSREEIDAQLSTLRLSNNNGDSSLPLVRYFDRLCRAFMRQHQIRDHEDDASYKLIQDPWWQIVREVLGARIVEHEKFVGGPRTVFYQLDRPEQLLNPVTEADRMVRAEVIRRARVL